MTATELLREARNYLSTWAICKDGNRCKEIVDRIDAFLFQPEPTMSAEEMREACAKICEHGVKWTPEFPPNIEHFGKEVSYLLAKAIRSLDLSRKEKA